MIRNCALFMFYSTQWFLKRTVNDQIRLRMRRLTGSSLSAYNWRQVFVWRGPFKVGSLKSEALDKKYEVERKTHEVTLRKHSYSNILKLLWPKKENFQVKNSDIFHISGQNIDCGYSLEPPQRGGSNEYPQSMFWPEIRKIMYTPVNPSFTI